MLEELTYLLKDVGDRKVKVVKKTLSVATAIDEIDTLRYLRDTQADEEKRQPYQHSRSFKGSVSERLRTRGPGNR